MQHLALARKWRPGKFDELVGQQHIVKALTHALDNDRLHHAYLFTGTRGVGKTTIARIFAKSLNCEQGVSAEPCGQCAICTEVASGRFIDLLEVDAASRTKVEDTREMLDNVQYAPTRGRYKVYLIDEVHMLSGHSFNALLKTLEEPPSHVKFLLATTDPQKLPVTVLSRCIQLNLRRLTPEQITSQLQFILGQENIPFENRALQRIAKSADGSLRDALSLLDQAIAFCSGEIEDDEVKKMLGDINTEHLTDLLNHVIAKDANQLIQTINEIAAHAPDFGHILSEISQLLHHIAIAQFAPQSLNPQDYDSQAILSLAEMMSPEDAQLYYQIAITGQRDLELAPDPRTGVEMTLLRMLAFKLESHSPSPSKPTKKLPPETTLTSLKNQLTTASEPTPTIANKPAMAAPIETKAPQNQDWHQTIASINVGGIAGQLVQHCELKALSDSVIHLSLATSMQHLRNDISLNRLQEAFSSHYGRALQLNISLEEELINTPAKQLQKEEDSLQARAESSIAQDSDIRSMIDEFDAKIAPNSTAPFTPNNSQ